MRANIKQLVGGAGEETVLARVGEGIVSSIGSAQSHKMCIRDSRNMPIADLVKEAEQIAAAGQREIVITGINTGDFGRTTGERFIDLLRALNEVEGIERYRISSIEPNLLTDEIIAFCASSPKFQHHFHIPLQSGSDSVLARMRRRYTTAKFAERIEAVRRLSLIHI